MLKVQVTRPGLVFNVVLYGAAKAAELVEASTQPLTFPAVVASLVSISKPVFMPAPISTPLFDKFQVVLVPMGPSAVE